MTAGALLFAYNNEKTDYVAMAAWTAKNIHRHLNIPVCLVTDVTPEQTVFDHVVLNTVNESTNTRYFSDLGNVTWHNKNRMDAYSLTPWDRTLVLDVDYVVASDQLKTLLEVNYDFLAPNRAYDIVDTKDFSGLNNFGDYAMPMLWATIMMFQKSHTAELIFNSMQMIRDNWNHYRALYKNNIPSYRNDHALTIASNIVNGHVLDFPTVPWGLASLIPGHKLTQIDQDSYRIDYTATDGKSRWIKLTGQDFHAMGKEQLGVIVANNS